MGGRRVRWGKVGRVACLLAAGALIATHGEEGSAPRPPRAPVGLPRLADVPRLWWPKARKRRALKGVLSGNVRLKITASVGLALWDRKESAETFFRRADQQLYQAKKTGRNRVCA